jgi:hypothetical protein
VGVAILVGVGKYPRYSGLSELHYPGTDVDTLAAALRKRGQTGLDSNLNIAITRC